MTARATDLVIVGAGGHGREALAVVRAAIRAGTAEGRFLGFVDDELAPEAEIATEGSAENTPDEVPEAGPDGGSDGGFEDGWRARLHRLDAPLLGDVDTLIELGAAHVIAVGDNDTRRRIDARIGGAAPAAVLVDPTAWVGEDIELGPGTMLYPGSRCTTDIHIGRHTHVNCGATVSHDCRIGDYVSISPGVLLNGDVTVGDGAFLGSGAVVLPGRRVGEGAIVGAGAVVTADVTPGETWIGVPARPV